MEVAVAYVLAGLAVVLIAHVVARRTGLPSAVLLVVAGVVYAQLPGPNLTLDPKVVLVVVLPPLLYAAALSSSVVALRSDAVTIAGLSVGLVLVTAARGRPRPCTPSSPPCPCPSPSRSARPSRRPTRWRRCRSAAGPDCPPGSSRWSRARACSTTPSP